VDDFTRLSNFIAIVDLSNPGPMDTKRCADFAVAHTAFTHSENNSAELFFVRITQITFG
jgi:hypothetical protein